MLELGKLQSGKLSKQTCRGKTKTRMMTQKRKGVTCSARRQLLCPKQRYPEALVLRAYTVAMWQMRRIRNAIFFVTFGGGFIWLSAEGIHGRTSTAIAAEAVAESVLHFFADGMRFSHH